MREFHYAEIRDRKWDSEILSLVAGINKEAGSVSEGPSGSSSHSWSSPDPQNCAGQFPTSIPPIFLDVSAQKEYNLLKKVGYP